MKSKRIYILFSCITALSFGRAFSQLVVNGNFENIQDCPTFWSESKDDFKVSRWYSPSKATPDYYAECSEQCNINSNWMQKRIANSNGNYIGLIAQSDKDDYREYLQTELASKLEKGSFYTISFSVLWPAESQKGLKELNVLFTENKFTSKKESKISTGKFTTPLKMTLPKLKGVWITVESEYYANGSESYLTIGDFTSADLLSSDGKFPFAYYFIDDVQIVKKEYKYQTSSGNSNTPNVISRTEPLEEVTESHLPGNCTCWSCMIKNGEVDKQTVLLEDLASYELEKGQRIDLDKIIFDVESQEITKESSAELNKLYFVLSEQPNAQIRFVVYTYPHHPDGKGLAKETSLKIYKYLHDRGITNSISFLHTTSEALSKEDGISRDRNIEMLIVNNN